MKTKKHILLPIIVMLGIISVSITSCKQLDRLTMFNLGYTYDFVIPPTPASELPIDLVSPEFETNSEEEFAFHSTHKDKVEEIRLTQLSVQLLDFMESFTFVKSVEVYLKADGLPETLVAWKTNVPDNVGTRMELEVTNDDLASYLKKDKMTLRLRAVTDEPIEKELPVQVASSFHVDAKILGL